MSEYLETKSEIDINQAQRPLSFVPFEFVRWYYAIAPKNIIEIWGNYLVANLHYFSIPLLLRTLFAHWHRDVEGYGRGFDFSRYLTVFLMNLSSRLVGFVVRGATVLVGLTLEALVLFSGICFLVFWLAAPLVILVAFFYGITLLF